MLTGRPPNVMRPVKLTTNIPEDLRAQLDLHLFSPVEGRIPKGAYSRFLCERIREFFDPLGPNVKLAALKRQIEQTEFDTWTEEQQQALRAFRDHLLERC